MVPCKEGTKMSLSAWIKGEDVGGDGGNNGGKIFAHCMTAEDGHGANLGPAALMEELLTGQRLKKHLLYLRI